MNWKNNRIMIASAVLILLIAISLFALAKRDAKISPRVKEAIPTLPEIDSDKITAFELIRGTERIRIEKQGESWQITKPLKSEVDMSNVDTAIEKLGSLNVLRVAASRPESHVRLEVGGEDAVRVKVEQEGREPTSIWIGAYGSTGNMVRVEGHDEVLAVEGSLRYAFRKAFKEWRNRKVTNIPATRIHEMRFVYPEQDFHFVRDKETGDFVRAEGQEAIDRYGASQTQAYANSMARLLAFDFASEDIEASVHGLAESKSYLELGLANEDQPIDERIRIRIGNKQPHSEYIFVQVEGRDAIYLVTKETAARMMPKIDKFQTPDLSAKPAANAPDLPVDPSQLDPETMKKLQQMMQQGQ